MTNIFSSARFKITVWYVSIIAIICLSYSAIIYSLVITDIENQHRNNLIRLKAYQYGINLPNNLKNHNITIAILGSLDPSILSQIESEIQENTSLAKNLLKQKLLFANIIIIFLAGASGYFLSGITLEPIIHAMDDQNRFIADSSHELKTPITAIKSSLEVNLRNKKLDKSAKTILESNLEEINNLEEITTYLLDSAKTQYSDKANQQVFDVSNLITQLKKTFSPITKTKNIKLKFNYSPLKLLADPQKIKQLVSIFIDNAIKYSDLNQTISISIKSFKKQAIFIIKDQGIGIKKSDQKHIFDRFYRADPSRCKTNCNGFGLGLSIAQNIVKSYNGSISLQSQENKGTTFTIKLPIIA